MEQGTREVVYSAVELLEEGEASEGGREVVYRVVEKSPAFKIGEGGREVEGSEGMAEVGPKCQVGD